MPDMLQESPPSPEHAVPISVPPSWGNDSLSGFFEAARKNQFGTFVNKKEWFTRIADIDKLFVKVSKEWVNPRDPLAAILFLRCRFAFRAASSLALAGQVSES
jgi:hypothetical protein